VPTFTPPTRKVYRCKDRLWRRNADVVGRTVLKNGASYTTVDEPSNEELGAATIAYLGGHSYTVSAGESAALTAAGYGANIT